MIKQAIQAYRHTNTSERLCIWWAVSLTAITCIHIVFTS